VISGGSKLGLFQHQQITRWSVLSISQVSLFTAAFTFVPLWSFETGRTIVAVNKVTGEGEQILDDIGSLSDHDGLTQFDLPSFEFDQFRVFYHEDSISRIQVTQKYFSASNTYLGMLFTGGW
jgi:hypothetical protein